MFAPALPGAQQSGQRFAGRVGEAQQRVEPEPALVGRAGPLLVLRMDLDERRVDVQHHHRGPCRCRHPPPHVGAHDRGLRVEVSQHRRCDLADRSIQRRVRRHRAEQARLRRQELDVRAGFTARGEHQHRVRQHDPTVVQRGSFPSPRDRRRQGPAETDPVRESTQRVQPGMSRDLRSGGFHTDVHDTVTVHFASALLVGVSWSVARTRRADQEGLSADTRPQATSDSCRIRVS